jgi:DNA-binding MurR/RpiR family transcriptional regulator
MFRSGGRRLTLLESIRAKAKGLSRSQQAAAYYFADHWEEVAYMSTFEIAARTGLSQATIVRTAASLGFSGFVALQEGFRELIQQTLSTVSRLDRLGEIGVAAQSSDRKLMSKVFEQLADNLQKTYQRLQPETLQAAVRAVLGARQVVVVGMRSSAAAAHYLGFNLSMVMANVATLLSDAGLAERLRTFESGDVMVVISFPRYTHLAVEAARLAKQKGGTVVAITDSTASPLSRCADHILCAAAASSFYNQSLVSIMAVVDLFFAQLVRLNAAPIRKSLEQLERELDSLRVFET